MKKIFMPPVAPLILFIVFIAFVIMQPVQLIDGHPDNAPHRAVIPMILCLPLVYLFFTFINSVDMIATKCFKKLSWIPTITLIGGMGFLGYKYLFVPNGDSPEEQKYVMAIPILITSLQIVPMSLWRRKIEKTKPNQSTHSITGSAGSE